MINVVETAIPGVLIIEPKAFGDARGYFMESFNAREFAQKTGLELSFVQDNLSKSRRGVLRGLHFQRPPFAQSKLVGVVKGRVLDVAVDIRKGSAFIPRGFAHGFAVLSEEAIFQYKCDAFYAPEAEGGISILDASLGIDWGLPMTEAILSEKDTQHPLFKDFESPFTL